MKVVAIIQGRMSSSRLPGKVLKEIGGEPMLGWVVERTRRAACVDEVVVATTVEPSDDPIAGFCAGQGIACYRGDLFDVLDRFYQAAGRHRADVIVRITADCPFIDPGLIDQTVQALLGSGSADSPEYDFAANRLPPPWKRTYPIGLDVEVTHFAALERAWREAVRPHEREHVMPYLYEDHAPGAESAAPHRFRIHVLNHAPDYGDLRWTVDTPEDLEFVRQVYARFPGRDDFSWREVLALLRREPSLARINAGVQHRTAFDVDNRR